MSLSTQEKEKIFKKFGENAKDTGSVFSQVALFTKNEPIFFGVASSYNIDSIVSLSVIKNIETNN